VTSGPGRLLDGGAGAARQGRALAERGLDALLDLIAPVPGPEPARLAGTPATAEEAGGGRS